jgi:hypothetical protein
MGPAPVPNSTRRVEDAVCTSAIACADATPKHDSNNEAHKTQGVQTAR